MRGGFVASAAACPRENAALAVRFRMRVTTRASVRARRVSSSDRDASTTVSSL